MPCICGGQKKEDIALCFDHLNDYMTWKVFVELGILVLGFSFGFNV